MAKANEQPFYQKLVLIILQYFLPSVLALTAAIMAGGAKDASNQARDASEKVEQRLRAVQARLDERDLLAHEAFEGNLGIPIGDDEMWRDYFDLVKNTGHSRKEAAEIVLQKRTAIPSKSIADEVWSK
jgi:hypothetical protein